MPAPSIRSTSTASNTSSLSLTLNKPTGTVENDVLLLLIMTRNITTTNLPSGFVVVATTTGFGETYGVIAKKKATSSEPSTYSPTFTDSFAAATAIAGILHAISDANYDDIISLGTATNTSIVPSSSLIASDNNLVFSAACHASDPSTNATQPSGWSLITSVASSVPFEEQDCRVQSATKEFQTGSIGSHSWSASRNMMLACAVPPSAGSTGAGKPILMLM